MPPILQYGFRPFFLLGALHAGLAVPLWLWLYRAGVAPPGPFDGMQWHAHEMLFGYLAAVIAGFVLTAVPNWTGRLPLSGWPLAGLVMLWLLGRVACVAVGNLWLAAALDLLFPVALAAAVWREVIAGRNWRNAPVAAILSLFATASAAQHGEALAFLPQGLGIRIGLGAGMVLIALIGGRVVPSFTRNWLAKQGHPALPASSGLIDKAALAATGAGVLAWIVAPEVPGTGILLVLAGMLLLLRLARWRGVATWREPIVLVLHAGYGWIGLGVTLLGISALWPGVPANAALHALTAGAMGTMTLAVMTRASLGHTGRTIRADGWTVGIYLLVSAGGMLRVAAPFAGGGYMGVLVAGGMLWSAAFVLFVLRYGPMLLSRRATA